MVLTLEPQALRIRFQALLDPEVPPEQRTGSIPLLGGVHGTYELIITVRITHLQGP